MMLVLRPEQPLLVALIWEAWNGETSWSRALRRFGELGGRIKYWGGHPSKGKMTYPVRFELYGPDGTKLPCNSRLKDIKAAIAALETEKRQ